VSGLPPGVTHRTLLLRHGEPVASARGRCYGKLDVALSESGRAQVAAAIPLWARLAPSLILVSPRTRTRESATILAQRLGVEILVDERLREIDFGELEGRTYDEVAAADPVLYERWMSAPTAVRFPGGESWPDVLARVTEAMVHHRRDRPGATLGLVVHGGTVRAALSHALAVPDGSIFRLDVAYATTTCIDWYDDAPVLRFFGAGAPLLDGETDDRLRGRHRG